MYIFKKIKHITFGLLFMFNTLLSTEDTTSLENSSGLGRKL